MVGIASLPLSLHNRAARNRDVECMENEELKLGKEAKIKESEQNN
jgi:hypothetical protein